MKDDFIYFYLTTETVRSFPCLQAGHKEALSTNAMLVLLLAASASAWCSDCFEVSDYNKYTSTKDNESYIKDTANISDRAYSDALRELVNANMMYKVKRNVYIINSWVVAHGNAVDIQKHRLYCYQKGIFPPPIFGWRDATTEEEKNRLVEELNTDANKQKHACVYVNNFRFFACLRNNTARRANATELIVFFMFATSAQFVKYPTSIELNNVVSRSVKEIDKLAELLGLKKRAIQYALNNLTDAHLLHKIDDENGKYIVNPFLSAKGQKDKVNAFQRHFFDDKNRSYFSGFPCGELRYENFGVTNIETGEVISYE